MTSFGGGVAATYVFLHLLPRLAEANQAVAAVLGDKVHSTPLAGLVTSLVALLLAVATGLHIFATGHVLAEQFPVRLTGRWRFVLAAGALTGWLVAVAVQPTGTPLINTLTAFLGGAILLNVFIEELPPERAFQLWLVRGGSGRLRASADLRKGRR